MYIATLSYWSSIFEICFLNAVRLLVHSSTWHACMWMHVCTLFFQRREEEKKDARTLVVSVATHSLPYLWCMCFSRSVQRAILI